MSKVSALFLESIPCCDNGTKQPPGKGGKHGNKKFDE